VEQDLMADKKPAQPASVGDDHRPLRDIVCDAIRDRITAGTHRPGERLVEDRLADDLGVSRNPVREALRVLEVEGYVELIPRRGAVVASLSPSAVDDIFEVRSALEALGARLAARHASVEQAARMARVLDESDRVLAAGDVQKLPALNTEFHQLVLELAGNALLAETMAPLRGRMQWIFSRTVEGRAPHSLAEHRALADAIAGGDEERAAALAVAHVTAAHATYRSALADGLAGVRTDGDTG
jgi:DNA-binding GntR family transcriptional regulator